MAEIVRRPLATEDLIEIWTHIAADDQGAADRVLGRIDRALTMLAANPLAGRGRPELRAKLRSFPVGSHVLFYEPTPHGIELARVLSGYRDIDRISFDD